MFKGNHIFYLLFLSLSIIGKTYGQLMTTEEMETHLDVLIDRGVISDNNRKTVLTKIRRGEVSNGTFDLLPYMNVQKVIDLTEITKETNSEKAYLTAILYELKDLGDDMPEFEIEVDSSDWKCVNRRFITSMIESEISFPPVTWRDRVYSVEYRTKYPSNYCLKNEYDLVYMLNEIEVYGRNDPQYEYVIVHNYSINGIDTVRNDSVFGVVKVNRGQIAGLYDYHKPWLGFYDQYITKENIIEFTNILDEAGIIHHLVEHEKWLFTERLLSEPRHFLSELLLTVPNFVDTSSMIEPQRPWTEINFLPFLQGLTTFTRGDIELQNIHIDDSSRLPHYSFRYDGEDYEYYFDRAGEHSALNKATWTFGNNQNQWSLKFDFAHYLNVTIGDSIHGRFYPIRTAKGDKLVYLKDSEYRVLVDNKIMYVDHENYLSAVPFYLILSSY